MSWLDWEEEEAESSPAGALYEEDDDEDAAAASPFDDVDDSPNVGDENTVASVSILSSGPRSSSPNEDSDRTRPLDCVGAGEGAFGRRLGELRDDELVDDERGGGVRVKSTCDGPVDLVEFRSEDRRRAAKGRKPLDGRGGVDGPPALIVDREDARRILSSPELISPNSPASPLGKVSEG